MKVPSKAKRKLHWVCESPSHYNDFLFRALTESSEFELNVHYRSSFDVGYQWGIAPESGYSARSFSSRFDRTLFALVLRDQDSLFLTSCWQDLTCQVILIALMIIGRPYLIWNDTPTPRRRGWFEEKARVVFLRAVFRHATTVLGTGSLALKAFREIGAPPDKLLNFPYCVDLNRFAPGITARASTRFVLGTCARLERIKGVDVALRALAKCDLSARPFLYRIAGAGSEEGALRDLVRSLGLTDCVEFCGWLQPRELPDFYKSLDVYLHPALFEPYGVAVVEALASGIPVLASDRTSSAIDLTTHENGLLHRAGNPDDVRRTLETFVPRIVTEREKMSQSARKAATAWTVEQAVETIERIVKRSDIAAPEAAGVQIGEGA